MRKVVYSGLAILVLGLLAVPAWAQKGGRGRGGAKAPGGTAMSRDKASTRSTTGHTPMSLERSNKGGEVRGRERAMEVQGMNTKADTERGFSTAPGLEKSEQRAGQKDKTRDMTKDRNRDRDQEGDRDRQRDENRDQ